MAYQFNKEEIKNEFKEYLKESKEDCIVLPGSYKSCNLIQFHDFEIADENGRSQRKGEIKAFERENFEEQYDLELPKKKSEFPFIADFKNGKLSNPIKVKIVDETNSGYFVTYTGIKSGCVLFFEGNGNYGFFVNKKNIDKFKKIDEDNGKELSELIKIAEGK